MGLDAYRVLYLYLYLYLYLEMAPGEGAGEGNMTMDHNPVTTVITIITSPEDSNLCHTLVPL
jgi:hypothetical protein